MNEILKCPACGSGSFHVRVHVDMLSYGPDFNYDDDCTVECADCDKEGTVADFRPDLLDGEIKERALQLAKNGVSGDDINVLGEPEKAEDGYWVKAEIFVRKSSI